MEFSMSKSKLVDPLHPDLVSYLAERGMSVQEYENCDANLKAKLVSCFNHRRAELQSKCPLMVN